VLLKAYDAACCLATANYGLILILGVSHAFVAARSYTPASPLVEEASPASGAWGIKHLGMRLLSCMVMNARAIFQYSNTHSSSLAFPCPVGQIGQPPISCMVIRFSCDKKSSFMDAGCQIHPSSLLSPYQSMPIKHTAIFSTNLTWWPRKELNIHESVPLFSKAWSLISLFCRVYQKKMFPKNGMFFVHRKFLEWLPVKVTVLWFLTIIMYWIESQASIWTLLAD
jgi:hypothetical protein